MRSTAIALGAGTLLFCSVAYAQTAEDAFGI